MSYSRKLSGVAVTSPSAEIITNTTGSTINKGTPITVNHVTGLADLVNVSDELMARATIGLALQDIPDGQQGYVITDGRVLNVSVPFSYGSTVFVSKTGGLTDVSPDIGGGFVDQDFIIVVGTVAKNTTNPTQKDIIVKVIVADQL